MQPTAQSVLDATTALRRSPGYQSLSQQEREEFERNMARIEAALAEPADSDTALGESYGGSNGTRYGRRDHRGYGGHGGHGGRPSAALAAVLRAPARAFETPNDLRGGLSGSAPTRSEPAGSGMPGMPAFPGFGQPSEPERKTPGTATEVLGERARRVLDAVDFPAFVASLIGGTFQAIVDATAQQVREYAALVADLSKSVAEFTRDRVTDNQARDYLHGRHGRDLRLSVPAPGEGGTPRLEPRDGGGESPAWLSEYGLQDEPLTPELVEGELLAAGRRAVGEDRMRTLATMVLMGINRIVVDNGELRARLQFHARARERTSAEVLTQTGGQQMGIAGRSNQMQSAVSTMVSTVDVNTQSDVSIKTDLVGEVAVRFRTETFDLQNFADTPAIALINRHALQREAPSSAERTAAVAPAPVAPAPVAPLTPEGDAT